MRRAFTGTDQLNADIEGVGDEDDLERWSYERDRREDHSHRADTF